MKCICTQTFEAVQYTGDNFDEIAKITEREVWYCKGNKPNAIMIFTPPFGNKYVNPKDWILIAEDDFITVCGPDHFEKNYTKI